MTRPPFEIVSYRASHRAPVVDLLRVGLREQEAFAAQCNPPEDEGFFDDEFREHLEGLDRGAQRWIVAVDDGGAVVGVLRKSHGDDRLGPYASVRQIIVAPDARRRGIGSALLQAVEAEARESEAVMMLISAFRTNPAARLYRSLGFVDFPPQFRLDTHPEHVVLWKCFRPDAVWFGRDDAPEEARRRP